MSADVEPISWKPDDEFRLRSILYPDSLLTLLHDKSIRVELTGVAVNPLGAEGGVPEPAMVKLHTGLVASLFAMVLPTIRQK